MSIEIYIAIALVFLLMAAISAYMYKHSTSSGELHAYCTQQFKFSISVTTLIMFCGILQVIVTGIMALFK